MLSQDVTLYLGLKIFKHSQESAYMGKYLLCSYLWYQDGKFYLGKNF